MVDQGGAMAATVMAVDVRLDAAADDTLERT
jgi:hypothetical protein